MKTYCFWLVSLGTVLVSGITSRAEPGFGANCASCHSPITGRMSLSGETATANLGSGFFKTYDVTPGNTVRITEDILNGSDHYAVSVRNFELGGRQNDPNNLLSYTTPNLALNGWNTLLDSGSGATYYSTSVITDGSTPSFNFDISVSTGTPSDYYELILTMAGNNSQFGQFAQEEHVYLNVVPEPQTYALATGLCLVGFAAYRRLGGKPPRGG